MSAEHRPGASACGSQSDNGLHLLERQGFLSKAQSNSVCSPKDMLLKMAIEDLKPRPDSKLTVPTQKPHTLFLGYLILLKLFVIVAAGFGR